MGTAVVFDIRRGGDPAALASAVAFLHWVDRTFSTYRADSEISRIGRGELSPDDAAPEVRQVLTACSELKAATDGWFDPAPGLAGAPALDPSGYVKGWATGRAAEMLLDSGASPLLVNAGGDIVAAGSPDGRPWRVGIRHPLDRSLVIAEVDIVDGAIATSGEYERGAHIWSPRRGRTAAWASATVVGPDLGIADALATAVFAAGGDDLSWFDAFTDYTVLLAPERPEPEPVSSARRRAA